MSSACSPPVKVSKSLKTDRIIASQSPVDEGLTTKVHLSETSYLQPAIIAAEKDIEKQVEKPEDGLSHGYPGSILAFYDASPMANFVTLNTSATPAPETHPSFVRKSTGPHMEPSGPIYNPNELREIFPIELPPRPAPKSNFFSRIFKRKVKQSEDIEMVPRASVDRKPPRYTLLPVQCHWSFLVGGWVFLMSCGAIAYWGVSEQLNKDGNTGQEMDGAVQVVAALLKR